MKDFLFEVLSEEIPATYQLSLEKRVSEFLEKNISPLKFSKIQIFIASQRIAFILHTVQWPKKTEKERNGPLVQEGETALKGFCQSLGIEQDQCFQKDTPRGLIWAAHVQEGAKDPAHHLIQLSAKFLRDFYWPKRMRCKESTGWVRPIKSLICLYGNDALPWQENIPFIPHFPIGATTKSHRFFSENCHSNSCPISGQNNVSTKGLDTALINPLNTISASAILNNPIKNLENYFYTDVLIEQPHTYEAQLYAHKIIVDGKKRQACIKAQLYELANFCKGTPHDPDFLIKENAGMTQWPISILCDFDPSFLALPAPVVITVLQAHQRCFAIYGEKGLLPKFVAVLDVLRIGADIKGGYERVISARLADALFFWQQDIKNNLISYNALLNDRLFFDGLGTLYDKVLRMQTLAPAFAQLIGMPAQGDHLYQAASLSKADLSTAMVGEFPSLQGIMGRFYAQQENIQPAIAEALGELYIEKPATLLGRMLIILDCIDSLVGFFALGKIPSGSKDPMGLRRMTHRIIYAAQNFSFSLKDLVDLCLSVYHQQNRLDNVMHLPKLIEFFQEKAEAYMRQQGFSLACIAAVEKSDNFCMLRQRALLVQKLEQETEGIQFLKAYRRLHALLKSQPDVSGPHFAPEQNNQKDISPNAPPDTASNVASEQSNQEASSCEISSEVFSGISCDAAWPASERTAQATSQEKALYDLLAIPLPVTISADSGKSPSDASYDESDSSDEIFASKIWPNLAALCQAWAMPLHDFFDHVRVNDPPHQTARLALLNAVQRYFAPLGNLGTFFD